MNGNVSFSLNIVGTGECLCLLSALVTQGRFSHSGISLHFTGSDSRFFFFLIVFINVKRFTINLDFNCSLNFGDLVVELFSNS